MQKNPAAISWLDTFLTEILQKQMKSTEKDLFMSFVSTIFKGIKLFKRIYFSTEVGLLRA